MPRLTCACGAKYNFDESATGKKGRCKKCNRVFTILPDEDDGPIPLADDDAFDTELKQAAGRAKTRTPVHRVSAGGTGSLPVVRDMPVGDPSVPLVAPPTPARGYWGNVGWTFLFPTSINNLIIFFFMWGILCVSGILLSAAGCLGWVGQLVILGWYSAFRFETIAQAAAGEEDLPSLAFAGGILDGIVIPLLKWIGSWAIVLLPVGVCLAIMIRAGTFSSNQLGQLSVGGIGAMMQIAIAMELIALALLSVLALFIWPMVVLCVALGGFNSLSRVDLIVSTIIKTFPAYLFTAAMVVGTGVLDGVLSAWLGSGWLSSGKAILVEALLIGASLYLELVAMRLIGLYYHHFKHRFAWSWG